MNLDFLQTEISSHHIKKTRSIYRAMASFFESTKTVFNMLEPFDNEFTNHKGLVIDGFKSEFK